MGTGTRRAHVAGRGAFTVVAPGLELVVAIVRGVEESAPTHVVEVGGLEPRDRIHEGLPEPRSGAGTHVTSHCTGRGTGGMGRARRQACWSVYQMACSRAVWLTARRRSSLSQPSSCRLEVLSRLGVSPAVKNASKNSAALPHPTDDSTRSVRRCPRISLREFVDCLISSSILDSLRPQRRRDRRSARPTRAHFAFLLIKFAATGVVGVCMQADEGLVVEGSELTDTSCHTDSDGCHGVITTVPDRVRENC